MYAGGRPRLVVRMIQCSRQGSTISSGPGHVWVPTDFARLGNRDAIDKTLQRMVLVGDRWRIDRGLYDKPIINRLTQRPSTPDYRAIVDAIAWGDQLRLLVDGSPQPMTSA